MRDGADLAIQAVGLRKSFGDATVLDGVDLTVEKGTMLALLGPNGARKTTTVRILSTLLPADGGVATVAGFDVTTAPDSVRGAIGITGQYASVDEMLTGRENLVMIGRLYHLRASVARKRATELLDRFDLVKAADRSVKTYSGGMRRRLDLAASLVVSPPIVFLDEPTTGLDPRSRQEMWNVIGDLMASGTTILLTTQYLEEADQLADRVAVIDRGGIIAEGTAGELKRTVGSERLELAFPDADELTSANNLIGAETAVIDHERRTISLAVDGPAQIRHLLNLLADNGLTVAEVDVSRPTLDDVFFNLTGMDQPEGATAA